MTDKETKTFHSSKEIIDWLHSPMDKLAEKCLLTPEEEAEAAEKWYIELAQGGSKSYNFFQHEAQDAKTRKAVEEERLNRPAICRGCPRYETDCEGSNQEDCARLDRPELLKGLVVDIEEHLLNLEQGTQSDTIAQEIVYDIIKDKLNALSPTEEEIRRAVAEEIVSAGEQLLKSYKAFSAGRMVDDFWQTLKEKYLTPTSGIEEEKE